jgi:hypothetical protein
VMTCHANTDEAHSYAVMASNMHALTFHFVT